MTRPILLTYDSADHDPIDAWRPPEDEPVAYWLTIGIGTKDADSVDLFQVLVANADGLNAYKQSGQKLRHRPPIVVEPYSWEAVLNEVSRLIEPCADSSWARVVENLRKRFNWEYEDYR